MNKTGVHIVMTTCPPDRAEDLAQILVQEGLAACVSILAPARSVYYWQGHLEHAEECILWIKGPVDGYERLQQRLLELHPYELPEILAVPVTAGLPAYLAWLSLQR